MILLDLKQMSRARSNPDITTHERSMGEPNINRTIQEQPVLIYRKPQESVNLRMISAN